MSYNEADTRAKLIDPAMHRRGWLRPLQVDAALPEWWAMKCIHTKLSAVLHSDLAANLRERDQ